MNQNGWSLCFNCNQLFIKKYHQLYYWYVILLNVMIFLWSHLQKKKILQSLELLQDAVSYMGGSVWQWHNNTPSFHSQVKCYCTHTSCDLSRDWRSQPKWMLFLTDLFWAEHSWYYCPVYSQLLFQILDMCNATCIYWTLPTNIVLTPSLPCHLKTTRNSAKSKTIKPFFHTGMWKDFHQNV